MSIARALSFIAATAPALALGCHAPEASRMDPERYSESHMEIPVNVNLALDILFVIDDSSSMADEQASLRANFERFVGVLEGTEGGLFDVHIGVVSTDVGTGELGTNTGCSERGHDGRLLTGNGDCQGPSDAYIIDLANRVDGGRTKNYSGELSEAFSCIADLGTGGCGFEQPLEAMRRALDDHPANRGFLREDAYLAIIFITDEDDCSTRDSTMFRGSQNAADPELGYLSSFRCFEHGVICDPDAPREPGPKQLCRPRDDSRYMHDVQEYVDFLRGVKDDPRTVIVSGIVGVPSPVEVQLGGSEGEAAPSLLPSCASSAGEAAPAVRLAAFLESFPDRNTLTTICNEDLSDALADIATSYTTILPLYCLQDELADLDDVTPGVQPDCSVTDVVNLRQEDERQRLLPSCETSGTLPCWRLTAEGLCSNTPTGLTFQLCRGLFEDDPACPEGNAVPPPLGTTTVVRCALD